MRLKKIEFFNFKSLKKTMLEVDGRITVLVGENETGKSNVLKAIEKFGTGEEFDPHKDKTQQSEDDPKVILHFELGPEDEEFYDVFGLQGAARARTKKLVVCREGELYYIDSPNVSHDHSSLKEQVLEKQKAKLQKARSQENAEGVDEGGGDEGIYPDIELDKDLLEDGVIDWVLDRLPEMEYFPGHPSSEDEQKHFIGKGITLKALRDHPSNYPSLVKLLNLGGVDVNDPFQKEEETYRLENASKAITRLVTEAWKQEKNLEIKLFYAEGRKLVVNVKDGKIKENVLLSPEQRSYGFRWYFSFYVRFLGELKNKGEAGKILLFDEPGIFLHAEGQKELLKLFERIADNNNQIIYTTHSQHMLDSFNPHRIRLLEKRASGTAILNRAWTKGTFGQLPNPIRDVVGTLLVDTLYQGKVVLLVEGPSDKMLLHAFSELLASQKKPCIDFERIVLQPAYGASVCPAVASILKNENVPTVALLDSDSEGECIKQKLLDHGLLEEEDIIMLKQAVNPRSRRETIECLIPKHIIVEAVNKIYHPSSKFEKPDGGWWPIVSQLKAWLRKRKLISEKEDLDKISMANISKKHFTHQAVFDSDGNIQEDFRELHTLVEVLRKKLEDKLSSQGVQ